MRLPFFPHFFHVALSLVPARFNAARFAFAASCLLLAAQAVAAETTGFNYQLADSTSVITAVAVDAAANTYITGSTSSPSFPATPGAFQTQYGGGTCPGFLPFPCNDAFVIKLSPTGAVVWATYLGGTGNDVGYSIGVDAQGNVYVGGTTSAGDGIANNFPTTSGSVFPSLPPSVARDANGFVVKLNAAGSQMVFGTYLPGTSVGEMTLDSEGSVYIAGDIQPAIFSFPTTTGAFQTSSTVKQTGVVVKLNPAGSALVYSTYLGGTSNSNDTVLLQGIAVDSSGNAVVTGFVNFGDFPVTPGAYQGIALAEGSVFVTKLNAAGSGLIYSALLGVGQGTAVKLDSQGRVYVLGTAPSSGSFPTTQGAFEPVATVIPAWAPSGIGNSFLAALSADGTSLTYGTYITGAAALDVDASGDAYVAGRIWGGFPVSTGAFEACPVGVVDGFAAEFTPTGMLAGATYLGVADAQSVNAIAFVPSGFVSIAGQGQSSLVDNLPIDNPRQQDAPCVSPTPENAASYTGGAIAPGELVTLQGAGFGPDTGVNASPGANGLLPTQLSGVQVFFDDLAAPLLYVQGQQINVQAPWELAGRAATEVRVIYSGVSTNTVGFTVNPSAPGLFYSGTSQQGAVLNQDGSVNSPSNPAHAGDVISIFGTGGGPTSPAGVTGGYAAANANTLLTLPVSADINGASAPVVYAGAAPGLSSAIFQINVQIPLSVTPLPGPPGLIYVRIGNAGSLGVTFALQ